MIKELDQEEFYDKKLVGSHHFNYQEIKCEECDKKLKICQIQRKHINRCVNFVIFTYYCQKCKLTYFIFKFINNDLIGKRSLSKSKHGIREGGLTQFHNVNLEKSD